MASKFIFPRPDIDDEDDVDDDDDVIGSKTVAHHKNEFDGCKEVTRVTASVVTAVVNTTTTPSYFHW